MAASGIEKSNWMVKTQGRIVGPLTHKELEAKLRAREFSVQDEVALPLRRWTFIREEPRLQKVVDEIRLKTNPRPHDADGDTLTGVQDTFTGTLTEAIDGNFVDDLTDDVKPLRPNTIKDADFEALDSMPKSGATSSSSVKAPQYGYARDGKLQTRSESVVSRLWVITVLVLFGVVGYWIFQNTMDRVGQADLLTIQANEHFSNGNYPQALKLYERAFAANSDEPKFSFNLGILLIQLEGQTVAGRRHLNQALESAMVGKKEIYNALGVADLVDGDINQAQKHFNKALSEDSRYVDALINLGLLSHQKREYSTAKEYFDRALGIRNRDGELAIGSALNWIQLWQARKAPEGLEQARKTLHSYLAKSKNFEQEVTLLLAYSKFLENSSGFQTDVLERFIDMDPDQTSQHVQSLYLTRQWSGWDGLSGPCMQMSTLFKDPSRSKAYQAFCFLRSGQGTLAHRLGDEAVSLSPEDPLSLSVFALVLRSESQTDRSQATLTKAIERDPKGEFLLPRYLMARICESRSDRPCAEKYWRQVVEKNPFSVAALSALAQIHLEKRDYATSKRFVTEALRVSGNFQPLKATILEGRKEGLEISGEHGP